MGSTVVVEHSPPVTVVTIERPEVRNAVDGPTAAALADAFRRFDEDDRCHVAILTGSGGNFCSGADLRALAGGGTPNRLAADGEGPMGPSRMRLSKPVIAAVDGYCVAGGLELALWCDLRVATHDAVFGVFSRRFGVPLIDGGTVRLPRLIGMGRALDLILTGRPVDAEEAHAIGLVDRIVAPGELMEAASRLAEQIASFPQTCLRSDRRSAYEQWGHEERDAMANEFALGLATIETGETEAGARRFASGEGRRGAPAPISDRRSE